MINLISNSPTRAKILKLAGISFTQISFDFDESKVLKTDPFSYSFRVVNEKFTQFKATQKSLENALFADSSVIVDGEIYGKARDEKEAFDMLLKQSENLASVVTSMIFKSKNFTLFNTSITTFKFSKFDKAHLDEYIKSKECFGKAGAMMIEGFNKRYIVSQTGFTSTAMGLNVEKLKAYL